MIIITYDNFGQIICKDVPNSETYLYSPYIDWVEGVSTDTHYVDTSTGQLVEKDTKPTDHHTYNYETHTWYVTEKQFNLVKTQIKNKCIQYAEYLINNNILYDDKTIKANEQARKDILDKINQLTFEIELGSTPTNLIWFDANDNILTWDNVNDYLIWLKKLVIDISNRKTQICEKLRAVVEIVENMTDFNDVLNYPIELAFN